MVNFMDFKSIQGLSSCSTEASLMKLDVHQHLIVIYIYYKFDDLLFSIYLIMANFMDFKSIHGL